MGKTPSTKANEVMTIGRNRWRAASCAESSEVIRAALVLDAELDDQDRVLRREPDQHHQADLAKDVERHVEKPQADHCPNIARGTVRMITSGRIQLS